MESKKKTLNDNLSDLFVKWKKDRPNYEKFTHDGPLKPNIWEKQKPKILFLLKEAYNDFEPHPLKAEEIKGKLMLNIAKWRALIQSLYNQPEKEAILLENEEYKEIIDDIAIVEVKKYDEGNTESADSVINTYAHNDRKFLKDELELINPHIVICGGTFESYKIVYDIQNENSKGFQSISHACWKHNNRLVIRFYHPSPRSANDLFEKLREIYVGANVLNSFSW